MCGFWLVNTTASNNGMVEWKKCILTAHAGCVAHMKFCDGSRPIPRNSTPVEHCTGSSFRPCACPHGELGLRLYRSVSCRYRRRCFPSVSSLMSKQLSFRDKALWTERASIGLFTCAQSLMTNQACFYSKALLTDVADVRLLTRVPSFVVNEVFFAIKPFLTDTAGVRPLPSVQALMLTQVCLLSKTFLTDIADIGTFASVHSFMVNEISSVSKTFLTGRYCTHKPFHRCALSHDSQERLPRQSAVDRNYKQWCASSGDYSGASSE